MKSLRRNYQFMFKRLFVIFCLLNFLTANASDFDLTLKKYDKIFLYLYAEDCGYCVKFDPYYNKLVSKFGNKTCKFIKINAMTQEGRKIGQD